MKFCYHCGTKLSVGKEIFCPECGIKLEQTEIEDKETGPSIDIKDTKGDVIGVGSSGSGNIFGKDVDYTVNGNVIYLNVNNLSSEVVENLRDILSVQTQLPATLSTKEDYKEDVTKFEKLKGTQQKITNVLHDVNEIGKKEGTQIQEIKAGDLQISTDSLFVKDALARGTELFYKGLYSNALEWIEKALVTDPKNAEAWYNKGIILQILGKDEEAIQCYDKSIGINPNDASAWYNKGISLAKLGKDEDAINEYDKAIEIKPDHHSAWVNKGISFAKLGKDEEAIQCYDKSIGINPHDANAWYNKGVSLYKLGKYEEAIESFEKAIEIKHDQPDYWYNKGVSLANLHMAEEAIKCFETAIEIKPDYAIAWYSKGVILEILGKQNDARKCFDQVKKIEEPRK